jgi:hypothetical protein
VFVSALFVLAFEKNESLFVSCVVRDQFPGLCGQSWKADQVDILGRVCETNLYLAVSQELKEI